MAKTTPPEAAPAVLHVRPVAEPGDTYVVLPEEGVDLPAEEAWALAERGLVVLDEGDAQ